MKIIQVETCKILFNILSIIIFVLIYIYYLFILCVCLNEKFCCDDENIYNEYKFLYVNINF